MRIRHEPKLDFDDVLIQPKRSRLKSRKDVDLTRLFTLPNSKKHLACVPIIASNMDTVGTIGAAAVMQEQQMLTWLHKFHTVEELCRVVDIELNTFAMPTIGEGDDITILDAFWGVRIDVANGYRESFISFVKKVREHFPQLAIFAGNVCTPEITEELIINGADAVVIGIGSGSQCITRNKTGIGYPQLSAIMECADSAHGLGGLIVADGGCRSGGDIAKAFAAGADFVSLGTMLAGHDENTADENIVYEEEFDPLEGELEATTKPEFAKVYGMSSKTAMEKYYGGMADYRAAEGTESLVPYKGPLKETLLDILGSLRSTCTYVGAERLKDLSKRTTFVIRK